MEESLVCSHCVDTMTSVFEWFDENDLVFGETIRLSLDTRKQPCCFRGKHWACKDCNVAASFSHRSKRTCSLLSLLIRSCACDHDDECKHGH